MIRALTILLFGMAILPARAQTVVVEKPLHDRWHYPFNFTGGTRDIAVLFSAVGNQEFNGFNDRDGVMVMVWDTSGVVTPGADPSTYDVDLVRVTITHDIFGTDWIPDSTTDEWFQFDVSNDGVMNNGEEPDPDCGRPFELFGAGFGPTYTIDTWTETSPYIGGPCAPVLEGNCGGDGPLPTAPVPARDPYPFVFQDGTGIRLHVEDNVRGYQNETVLDPKTNQPVGSFTAIPWATGVLEQYLYFETQPECEFVNPDETFDIVFDLDLTLSDGRVRAYFQDQLAGGRVGLIITSMKETDEQAPGNPQIFMGEATEEVNGFPPIPGARAPKLEITLSCTPVGDTTGDSFVSLQDAVDLADCLNGPASAPHPRPGISVSRCGCGFDFDGDEDVDMRDAAEFMTLFAGDG